MSEAWRVKLIYNENTGYSTRVQFDMTLISRLLKPIMGV